MRPKQAYSRCPELDVCDTCASLRLPENFQTRCIRGHLCGLTAGIVDNERVFLLSNTSSAAAHSASRQRSPSARRRGTSPSLLKFKVMS
ncbi:unnamed protein product [Chondrus crispus]|uniref:Uncharacterized protein n=1 Tax=Chondrus crispus TaxID=2769 RepID=R7QS75_CHOCR|nr:unnamed protein product [Chondrus crispus]CDF40964.1 unnamed protein product [Chondrus crispus]|eukprot:XP_005711258.1 unnamed protein product [Chondrus crispus]